MRLERRSCSHLASIHRLAVQRDPARRRGLTLVEIMVSVALSLMLILAVVQAFDLLGSTISEGRAKMELATRLRRATNIVQRDLDSLTCPVKPWIDPDAGAGYFEYVEGLAKDADFAPSNPPVPSNRSDFGDLDDIVMCTVRSGATPFRGRGPNGNIVESTMAEVVWWVCFLDTDSDGQIDWPVDLGPGGNPVPNSLRTDVPMLMRRVLLIRPDLDFTSEQALYFNANRQNPFFKVRDVSARIEFDEQDRPQMIANSLSDLSYRHNRFAHETYDAASSVNPPFPSQPLFAAISPTTFAANNSTISSSPPSVTYPGIAAWSFLPRLLTVDEVSDFASDWLIVSDLLAFDVRAYDPQAPVLKENTTSIAVVPGDYAYEQAAASLMGQLPNPQWQVIGRGAYVDLGELANVYSSGGPGYAALWSMLLDNGNLNMVYDTWSFGYERDGIDQDSDNAVDEGTNGLDDDNDGLVDELDERETLPPYDVSLRGLEVRLRAIDVPSRQVRQTSVVGDFTR